LTGAGKVAALAGRRIDAPGSETIRFPRSSINSVREQLQQVFLEEKVQLLVCSAASGADLLALEVASELNIDFRIILPFAPDRFRATSVIDHLSEWGAKYDHVLRKAELSDNLIVVDGGQPDDVAYRFTTKVIIKEAIAAAAPEKAVAIVVWEGMPRGRGDLTLQFRNLAIQSGMEERVVLTRNVR
jgi:hypothetical protein